MRIFLLPVTTRRTLLYCERTAADAAKTATAAAAPRPATAPPTAAVAAAAKAASTAPTSPARTQTPPNALAPTTPAAPAAHAPSRVTALMETVQTRAAKMWTDWEQKPAGSWQQRVVTYGNAGLRRVAFEEWGLKSVPPLSARERQRLQSGAATTPVEVVYPASVIPSDAVAGLLQRLATEREPLHRKKLIWCFVGMPITIPVALIPVIPNLPFFYLVYRAWSHWRAIAGGKHIQFLLQHNQFVYAPSPALDAVYAEEKALARVRPLLTAPKSDAAATTTTTHLQTDEKRAAGQPAGTGAAGESEQLLLSHPRGSKAIAEALGSHTFEVELERAIWQVETALEKEAKEHEDSGPGTSKKTE